MRTVGVRELKDKLSHYLRLVRGGEELLVTDRGQVVAELRPPGRPGAQSPLDELIRVGLASACAPNSPSAYRKLPPTRPGLGKHLLDAERGER